MRCEVLAAVTALCLLACEREAPTPRTHAASPRPAGTSQPTRTSSLDALPAGTSEVTRTPSGYTVIARDARPFDVLAALGDTAGFRAERGAGAPEGAPLSLALESVPLEHALAAILAGLPHHVHHEFADGDLSPERPFEGRAVVLTRVTVGALLDPGRAPETAAAPEGPGRLGPPPPAEPGRRGKRAERQEDPERARLREEAEARERERAAKIERQWNDPRASVRLEAVELMEPESEDRERLEALLRDDPSAELRIAAAEALAEGDAFAVMEGLLAGLEDPDPAVVAAVVRGLEDVYAEAPNPRIRERVAELRQHRDPSVREAVDEFEEWIEE